MKIELEIKIKYELRSTTYEVGTCLTQNPEADTPYLATA